MTESGDYATVLWKTMSRPKNVLWISENHTVALFLYLELWRQEERWKDRLIETNLSLTLNWTALEFYKCT